MRVHQLVAGGRRRGRLVLLAALAALAGLYGLTRLNPRESLPAADPGEAFGLVQEGIARRSRGDLRGSAEALRQAAALLPDGPETHLQLGITYSEALEYDLALRELERAAQLAPGEAAAWGQLGKLSLIIGQLDAAERALRRAAQLRPDRAAYPALLGEVYRQRGDAESARKAIDTFRQALALNPRDADAYHRLGLTYQRLGRLGEAAVALKAATRFAPETPAPYYALAQVERSRGERESADRALRAFRRLEQRQRAAKRPGPASAAVQPRSGSREASALVAEGRRAFYGLSQPDQAIELFQRARQVDPADPDAHYNLGLVLHFVGRLEEAEEAFRQALALDPRNPRYHAWIGTIHLERGPAELEAAVAALRRSIELGPDYAYGHYQLGRAYLLQDRPAEAAPVLERAVALNPRYREAHYSLGQAYLRLGKRDAAQKALGAFRRQDAFERERRRLAILARAAPHDPAPRVRLARLLAASGDRTAALRLLKDITRAHPKDRDARTELARLGRGPQ